MNSIKILDVDIPLPLQFSIKLPFSYTDKQMFPWLELDTRRYTLTKELGKGGRATAYKGLVVDESGKRVEAAPEIVVKVPNLAPDSSYPAAQIADFLARHRRECSKEWKLTRERLGGCKYANPIFDFYSYAISWAGEMIDIPFTVQLHLSSEYAKPLENYLQDIGERREPYQSRRGKPVDNWRGMSSAIGWIKLARALAIGLMDIHKRRVVHGDIWPPNIFIKSDENNQIIPIFIDFGEAFPLEPKGDSRLQRDHAYRAPERNDAQSIVTQQADVYSFGKLLLHLAIGDEPTLNPTVDGYLRRDDVRKKMRSRNEVLYNDNPYIIDLICNCIDVDPINRPRMEDVVAALDSYVDFESWGDSKHEGILERTVRISSKFKQIKSTPDGKGKEIQLLEQLVGSRLTEIEAMVDGLADGVLRLRDTRERLILSLVTLFHDMNRGDRYISVTSPALWQRAALGLDGRYLTATKLAASRGAIIQRMFAVSVQELGKTWCKSLATKLEQLELSHANELAEMLLQATIEFDSANLKEAGESACQNARRRLGLVVKSYCDANFEFGTNGFSREPFTRSQDLSNSYLGLLVLGTMQQVRECKARHPASVFCFSEDNPEQSKYLLMMTDCHGRTPARSLLLLDEKPDLISAPELRGITVFRSVFGIPQDRIKELDSVFKRSINIGHWSNELRDIILSLSLVG